MESALAATWATGLLHLFGTLKARWSLHLCGTLKARWSLHLFGTLKARWSLHLSVVIVGGVVPSRRALCFYMLRRHVCESVRELTFQQFGLVAILAHRV